MDPSPDRAQRSKSSRNCSALTGQKPAPLFCFLRHLLQKLLEIAAGAERVPFLCPQDQRTCHLRMIGPRPPPPSGGSRAPDRCPAAPTPATLFPRTGIGPRPV